MAQAKVESERLGHNYVGTEHMLLAMVDDHESVAAAILKRLGLDPDQVKTAAVSFLTESVSGTKEEIRNNALKLLETVKGVGT